MGGHRPQFTYRNGYPRLLVGWKSTLVISYNYSWENSHNLNRQKKNLEPFVLEPEQGLQDADAPALQDSAVVVSSRRYR